MPQWNLTPLIVSILGLIGVWLTQWMLRGRTAAEAEDKQSGAIEKLTAAIENMLSVQERMQAELASKDDRISALERALKGSQEREQRLEAVLKTHGIEIPD